MYNLTEEQKEVIHKALIIASDNGTLDEFTSEELKLINTAETLVNNINYSPCCTELPIYMTYDNSDSEVFAAFTDKERCELESKEGGVPMQITTLYFGKRK